MRKQERGVNEAPSPDNGASWLRGLLGVQGVYYLITGVWPLVHMPSFLRVTGPKKDLWLVRTVGTLVTAIGAGLVWEASRGRNKTPSPGVGIIAAGSALGLAAIDAFYVGRGRIARIYLADAAAELGLAGLWAGRAATRRRGRPELSIIRGSNAD